MHGERNSKSKLREARSGLGKRKGEVTSKEKEGSEPSMFRKKKKVMPQREVQTYRGTVTERRSRSRRRRFTVGEYGEVRVRKLRAKRGKR